MSILAAIFGGGGSASDPGSVSSSTDSSSTERRSAGRGSGRNRTVRQTVQSGIDQLQSDLSMGLSTFGQTGEQQAQTLREAGYSDEAIREYQADTAASRERMRKSMMSQRDDNDRPATTEKKKKRKPKEKEQDIGVPKGTREAAGAAVAAAEEAGSRGRRGTIGTTMRGLTTEAETTGRRSLIGLIR